MGKLKTFRTLLIAIVVFAAIQFGVLIILLGQYMTRAAWLSMGFLMILFVYLAVLCAALIKLLKKTDR